MLSFYKYGRQTPFSFALIQFVALAFKNSTFKEYDGLKPDDSGMRYHFISFFGYKDIVFKADTT